MVQSRVTMKAQEKSSSFWKNIPAGNFFYSSVVLNILVVLTIIGVKSFLPPVVPLLYGRPEGGMQLLPSLGLILAPGVALTITFINLLLIRFIKDRFIGQVLIISSFLISLLTTITVLKIIFLVGFF